MKKILLLMLLVMSQLQASDVGNIVLYNDTIVARDNYTYSSYVGEESGSSDTIQNILKIKYYNDITNDLFFNIMVSNRYTNINKEYAEDVMRYRFEQSDTYIESLYLTYQFYPNWYLSVGIFPFTNGSYSELSGLGSADGTGIIKIIDTPLEAIFLIHKSTLFGMNTITRVGYGLYENKYDLLADTIEENVGGTDGYYLTYDIYDGFDSFKFNLFMVDYVKEGIPIGDIDIAAIAYNKYFVEQGIDVYGTFAINHTKLDLTVLRNNYDIPDYLFDMFPNAFDFEDGGDEYSYLYSLGIAKDIDSKIVESYNIGIEYTYAPDGWISFVNNTYTDNQNYSYLHGDNVFMWLTTRFTTDVALKLFYGISKHDEGLVIGNSSRTVPFDESPRESLKTNERYGMKLIIKY